MNNSSTLTANFSNYKLLSALFLFMFLSFAQTASAQSHVIILKGNQKPPGNQEMLCSDLGGVFNVSLYNQGDFPMTNILATITMVDNYMNNSSTLSSALIPINVGGGGNMSFSIPNNFPASSGYFIIDIQYSQGLEDTVHINQAIPFTVCGSVTGNYNVKIER